MPSINKRILRKDGKPVLDAHGEPKPWLDKRGRPRWDAAVYIGPDPSGRRRSPLKCKSFIRKKDAEAWAAKLEVKRNANEPLPLATETLGDWMDHWIKMKSRAGGNQRIRERTAYDYRRIIERWIREPPEGCIMIGRGKLTDVRPEDLEKLYLFIADQGLSSGTIRHVHNVIRQALKNAFQKKKIGWNPATAVSLPKGADEWSDEVPDDDEHVPSLNEDQARRFLEAARSDRYSALWHLLLGSGLRPSEAFALTWEDVDLEDCRARVWRALTRIPNKEGWTFTALKSDRSSRGGKPRQIRNVPLTRATVAELRKWRKVQARERLALGPEYQDSAGLVFTTPQGTPLHLSNLRVGAFRRVMATADWDGDLGAWGPEPVKPKGQPGPKKQREFKPAFRIYDLRHTRATLGIKNGEDPLVTSAILGHATVEFTLDRYAHVLPEQRQESATIMDRVLDVG